MRKLFLKLAVLCTAISLIFCCGVLAACGDETPETPNGSGTETPANTTYSVTVKLEDGTPVKNVMLKFCTLDENGEEKECRNTTMTDENGKVSITLKTDNYHVGMITGGYQVIGDVTTKDAGSEFTVTVKAVS